MDKLWDIAQGVLTLLGVVASGVFAARGARAAAAIQAEATEQQTAPAAKLADLQVLESSLKRVDDDNGRLRDRVTRMEVLVRAYAWTVDALYQWARHPVGDPPAPHPIVEEHNRTGV